MSKSSLLDVDRSEAPSENQWAAIAAADGPLPSAMIKAVREHADVIHQLLARTSVNVIQIGLRLQAVRNALGREHFQPWLKAEFRWSQSVASNYMRAARTFADLDCVERFQPSALFVLARKRCPPLARSAAIAAARKGERVTKAAAVELVRLHATRTAPPARAAGRLLQNLRQNLPSLSADQLEHLAAEILEMARRRRGKTETDRPAASPRPVASAGSPG